MAWVVLAAGLLVCAALGAFLLLGGSSESDGGLHAGNAGPYPNLAAAKRADRVRAEELHRDVLEAAGRFDSVKEAERVAASGGAPDDAQPVAGAAPASRRPGLRRVALAGAPPPDGALRAGEPHALDFWCPARGDCRLAALAFRAPAAAEPPTWGGLLGWYRPEAGADWSTRVWLTGAPAAALAQCVPFGGLHARDAAIAWEPYRAAGPDRACPPSDADGIPGQQPGEPPAAGARGTGCMAKPSACGYPDATNTGVPPDTELTRADGTIHLDEPGMTYSDVELHGGIVVEAPGVTIERVKIVCPCYYPIRADGSGEARDTVIRDVEIDLQGFESGKGIAFSGYEAQRVWFHNGMDCAHFSANVTITDSFCDLSKLPKDSEAHADGFQDAGASNITLRHNTIRNPNAQTSAILLPSGESDVTVDRNLLSGGGWTLYCGRDGTERETVTNNRFSREDWPKGGYWGPMLSCEDAAVNSGNVWDSTGRAIAR